MDQKIEVEKFLKNTLRVDQVLESHNYAVNYVVTLIARKKSLQNIDEVYAGYLKTIVKNSPMQKRKFTELLRALTAPVNGRFLNYLMAVPQQPV